MATTRSSSRKTATKARAPSKRCFVISPLGNESSEARIRADDVFSGIIQHVLAPMDYLVERGDRIEETGSIMGQVIRHIAEAQLIVADLTGAHANVFYELGVSHALRKATILLKKRGDVFPFDVADQRVIEYTLELRDVESCRERLAQQVKTCEEAGFSAGPSPLDYAIDLLKTSKSPDENLTGALLSKIAELQTAMASLHGAKDHPESLWGVLMTKQAKESKVP